MKNKEIVGDGDSFDRNWKECKESHYTHWTRNKVENQTQLVFRNHWILFQEIIANSNYNGGKNVLEIGCGRGTLSCYFSDAGYDCTLVDISSKVINIAETIFNENNLKAEFIVDDANNLNFKENTFDIIFSIGLLEHFEDVEQTLKEQYRILNKGGLFFAYVVPKYTNNIQREYKWINNILKGYKTEEEITKTKVFRSDDDSKKYIKILKEIGLKEINSSGVYPLPMISHSIEFPFSLMPKKSEKVIVEYFEEILKKRKKETKKNPWLCKEGYGQAFLIWGLK